MSRERRREMVDREHPALSTLRQCALMGISRSSVYYRPRAPSQKDLALMKQIDQQYLATPFYGSRRMKVWLDRQGHRVNRKRIQRLMRAMGLQARRDWNPCAVCTVVVAHDAVRRSQDPARPRQPGRRWAGPSPRWSCPAPTASRKLRNSLF